MIYVGITELIAEFKNNSDCFKYERKRTLKTRNKVFSIIEEKIKNFHIIYVLIFSEDV